MQGCLYRLKKYLYRLKTSSFRSELSSKEGHWVLRGGRLAVSVQALPLSDGSWEAVFAPSQNRTISAETARWYGLNSNQHHRHRYFVIPSDRCSSHYDTVHTPRSKVLDKQALLLKAQPANCCRNIGKWNHRDFQQSIRYGNVLTKSSLKHKTRTYHLIPNGHQTI